MIPYSLLGSSRVLAVGPVAIVSLLVATGVGEIVPPGGPEYLTPVLTLALLVGIIQLAMGIVGLGFLERVTIAEA